MDVDFPPHCLLRVPTTFLGWKLLFGQSLLHLLCQVPGSASFISLRPGTKHLLWIKYLARLGHRDLKPCSLPSGLSVHHEKQTKSQTVTIPCGKVQCELSEQPATGRHRCPQTGGREGIPREPWVGINKVGQAGRKAQGELCRRASGEGEAGKADADKWRWAYPPGLICLDFRL